MPFVGFFSVHFFKPGVNRTSAIKQDANRIPPVAHKESFRWTVAQPASAVSLPLPVPR
ncbi:hypothetical protein DF3PB_1060009 [uncultured Defluviicoccus sp.]|uniref:Uncharacterized protein n=1 Tax=metagenome TaxID=256318 RepID=A0A380T8I9_9ZZZZ|nr:hypothetical protein DF3PB_1060009 [uncultured Defluviicoccus sp.]